MATVKGTSIKRVYTLGSAYDNQSVAVETNKKTYRLKVKDLLPLIKKQDYITEKKIVHTYLKPKIKKEIRK